MSKQNLKRYPEQTLAELAKASSGDPTVLESVPLSALGQAVSPVDFGQQQATSFVIENRTSDPSSPVVGQVWLRTDL